MEEIDWEDAKMIVHTQERFPELTFVGVDGVLVRFGADVTEQANVAAFSFDLQSTTQICSCCWP